MRKKILIASSIILGLVNIALMSCILLVIKAVKVPTGAMANTIIPGDHLIVFRSFGAIERGEIVIFKYPKDLSVKYVARVVGLPGETIEIRDRSVFINGNELSEQKVAVKPDWDPTVIELEELSSEGSGSYRVFYSLRDEVTRTGLEQQSPDATFGTTAPFRIPDGQYFLLGDNRDNSLDSRFYGTVPRDLIWGSPTVIYWSAQDGPSHDETIRWERISKRVQ